MSQANSPVEYNVQAEAKSLLVNGILDNPLQSTSLPDGIKDAAAMVEYVGSTLPSIPINLRFAESISALQGFQSSMLNVLLKKKYGIPYQKVLINTDHAQHFIFFPTTEVIIDPSNPPQSLQEMTDRIEKYFPNCDMHHSFDSHSTPLSSASTNIYKTKDGRYYHIHASLNPAKTQEALRVYESIPPSLDVNDRNAVVDFFSSLVSKYTASELDTLINDQYRQAGTICYSPEEFFATEQGKATAHIGLYEIKPLMLAGDSQKLPPTWWPGGTPERPLQGLKVLDMTRIVAAPTIARSLAMYGAHVLRITSPDSPEGQARLRELIMEADVVVDGYRPGVGQRLGFGWEEVGKSGKRGDEVCCGSSYLYGKGMGLDDAVTPVFPNSDFCTGVIGATAVMQALIERAEKGGSYIVDCALNYYSKWLVQTVSTYPPNVWSTLWDSYDRPTFRHTDGMPITVPALYKLLKHRTEQLRKEGKKGLFDPEFYEDRVNKALGVSIRCVKPVPMFPERRVKTGYNIGTRPNGRDKAVWPKDFMIEVIE